MLNAAREEAVSRSDRSLFDVPPEPLADVLIGGVIRNMYYALDNSLHLQTAYPGSMGYLGIHWGRVAWHTSET